MPKVIVKYSDEWEEIDAYQKDNHWYSTTTNTLIKPEYIYNVKE